MAKVKAIQCVEAAIRWQPWYVQAKEKKQNKFKTVRSSVKKKSLLSNEFINILYKDVAPPFVWQGKTHFIISSSFQ